MRAAQLEQHVGVDAVVQRDGGHQCAGLQAQADHVSRTMQKLFGHSAVSTTMIYTQMLGIADCAVRSLLDTLMQ